MTREEIIDGLKFTISMVLLDPSTGETYTEPRNDMDRTTIDACRGAIELLEKEPVLGKVNNEVRHLPFRPYEGRDTLDRNEVLKILDKHKAENEADVEYGKAN